MEHEWDGLSLFCTHCGIGLAQAVDASTDDECHATSNVIAISHLVAWQRMQRLTEPTLDAAKRLTMKGAGDKCGE